MLPSVCPSVLPDLVLSAVFGFNIKSFHIHSSNRVLSSCGCGEPAREERSRAQLFPLVGFSFSCYQICHLCHPSGFCSHCLVCLVLYPLSFLLCMEFSALCTSGDLLWEGTRRSPLGVPVGSSGNALECLS